MLVRMLHVVGIILVSLTPSDPGVVSAGLIGSKFRPPYDCGLNVREAIFGKPVTIETPNYPQKVSHGVNCVIKLTTKPGNNIMIRWMGFVVDGCHEGNKVRIVDGDQQQFHCGDKRPPTYLSSTNQVEIAISVVNMQRKDRGIIYRFSYEASKPRKTGRRLASGKYLVSKYDESSSLIDNQQMAQRKPQAPISSKPRQGTGTQTGTVIQVPQAPQISTQGQQQDERQQSAKQHPQHAQQAPQGGQNQQQQQQQTNKQHRPQSPGLRKKLPSLLSPDSRHQMRNSNYQNYEIVEDENLEAENEEVTNWERAKPYVGLIASIIAVIIPVAFLIRYAMTWNLGKDVAAYT